MLKNSIKILVATILIQFSAGNAFAGNDVQKTLSMTKAIVAAAEKKTGMKAKSIMGGTDFCRKDGYCLILLGPVQLSVYGRGIADVLTTSQLAPSKYRQICSSVFAAISGAAQSYADEIISEAFQVAATGRKVKFDNQGVEIRIQEDLSNALECRFFKY